MAEATPTAMTLRFKHGLTTTLLYSDALTPIPTLIDELLVTLRERYPTGLPHPTSKPTYPHLPQTREKKPRILIPEDGIDVRLALPVDQYDTSKGWEEIKLSGGGLRDTAKSLGLKDGGIVAFKFVSNDGEESEDDEYEKAEADDGFVVQWPSYDEAYPEQMETAESESESEDGNAGFDESALKAGANTLLGGKRKRKVADSEGEDEEESDGVDIR